ncbi:MAG TPA: biopolymer transporter ExbD [Candidatus Acidoferrales bacterium]|nr:biopolymer transporter ExbD [Candidatus Acidoferrales bacterium]
MGISVGGHGSSMSEPNVVPLIDVLLVLIIIFMAITPTTPTGMAADVPQPPPKHEAQQRSDTTIVVQVSADGKLMINQTPVSWNDLGPQLTDIFKIRAQKIAFVKGDDSASFGYVEHAIDIMRGSGITDVGLITAKMESGG